MAAVTVANRKRDKGDVWLGVKMEVLQLTAPADADTYDASVYFAKLYGVFPVFNDAAHAVTDSIGVTWSGTTVTFEVVGVARNLAVLIIGA